VVGDEQSAAWWQPFHARKRDIETFRQTGDSVEDEARDARVMSREGLFILREKSIHRHVARRYRKRAAQRCVAP
jgi:hypothetical protein